LEKHPLELDADLWGLMDSRPELYALVLSTPEGDPVEMPAVRLRTMVDEGDLRLYPASYRLVLSHDHES
jgi:hypothetical protein